MDFVPEFDPNRKDNNAKVKFLWEGYFHSEFLPYKNNETWTGLFFENGEYKFKTAKVKIHLIKNPDLHDTEVKTNLKARSVFLVKGLELPLDRPVPTVFEYDILDRDADYTEITNTTTSFVFTEVEYTLTLENPINNHYPEKGTKLILSNGKDRQILRYLKDGCNDCLWSVIWAGDADLDGKLDFVLDLKDHYNVEKQVLFLSSFAEDGKLVKYITDFYSVGC